MGIDWAFLRLYAPDLWSGVQLTLVMTAICTVCGGALGLLLALGRSSSWRAISWASYVYIELFRCTPLLVQLVWFFFVIPAITGYKWSAFTAGTVGLSLNAAAYFAVLFQAGLLGVDLAQRHSASVLGLGRIDTLRFVILPQAIRLTLPPLVGLTVLILRSTSLTTAIGVHELMNVGTAISDESLRQVLTLSIVAVIYFILAYPLTLLGENLEARFKVEQS